MTRSWTDPPLLDTDDTTVEFVDRYAFVILLLTALLLVVAFVVGQELQQERRLTACLERGVSDCEAYR